LLIILAASTAVLLVAALTFFTGETIRNREHLLHHAQSVARIVGTSVAPALSDNDPASVALELSVLKDFPRIDYAAVENNNGEIVAEYFPSMGSDDIPVADSDRIKSGDSWRSLMIVEPITFMGQRLGRIVLRHEMHVFYLMIRRNGLMLLGVLLISAVFAVFIAYRLQRLISTPVIAISRQARRIAREKDYSMRLERRTSDEFGQMIDALNEMLGTVEDQAAELQQSYANLEQVIEQRTAELTRSNVELQHEIMVRRRIEKDLRKAKELAESAVKARSSFLANMSHEIRTPMNAILGFADLLVNRINDPESRDYLDSILSSGNTLLRLINDILDLSKIEAGKLDLQYNPFSPRTMLSEIRQVFDSEVSRKELSFDVEISDTLPDAIRMDEIRLRQVLLNLVGNAVKFTDKGRILLRAGMDQGKEAYKENGSGDLILEVVDTGIGIPREEWGKIFDAFQQTGGQDAGKYGGTGLGLAITKRLIDMMDGEIHMESEVNRGTAFEVRLHNVDIVSPDRLAHAEQPDTHPLTFRKSRILLVDDNKLNRLLCMKYLDRPEFDVQEAENGKQAVELAQNQHPDLILLDVKMPIMDGYQALQHIRKDDRLSDIPVIALTASAMRSEEKRMYAAGCNGYLRKPLSKKVLIDELNKHLGYESIPGENSKRFADEHARENEYEDETLPEETRHHIPDIVNQLETEFRPRWEQVSKTYVIGEIETFADDLRQLGEHNGLRLLVDWAGTLRRQAAVFNMQQIPETLSCFPAIIKKIERLARP
jgi:signal transduction histidine kinase/DNA-binding NarL/FixJ family response regulator